MRTKSCSQRSALQRFALVVICLLTGSIALAEPAKKPELVIYTYDSLVAKGGLGEAIFPLFEKKCQCRVRALPSGDGGQLLTRLQLDAERRKPTAHVVLGLDQNLWPRAKTWIEPWSGWKPKGYDRIRKDLRLEDGFLPYDYGAFAFMMDTAWLKKKKISSPPRKLSELLKPVWKRNVILQDPRTSTPGTAFLLYTKEVLGEEVWTFWDKLRLQWLTLAPGWDSAYGLFLKGEAPLVWSYTTSQAYHREHGDKAGRYQALLFEEGQPVQIEGAALVRGKLTDSADMNRAREFLEFLLSPEVQELVPTKNWMLPVVEKTKLPESFKTLPRPKNLIRPDPVGLSEVLSRWSRAVEAGK